MRGLAFLLCLALGPAVAAAAEAGNDLSGCAELSAREVRLACYDRVAGLATPVPATERAIFWQLRRSRDSITEQSRVTMLVPAERRSDAQRPELVVRCYDRRLDLFVSPAGTGMLGSSTSVTIRVDDNDPASQQWQEAAVGQRVALFAPNPQQMVDRLTRAERLTVEYEPIGQDRQVFSFPVAGLSGLLPEVAACRPPPRPAPRQRATRH